MPTDDSNRDSNRNRWIPRLRKALLWLGLFFVTVIVFKNTVTTWVVNGIFQWKNVDANVEFVEIDIFNRSVKLIQPEWSNEGGTRFIRTDTIQVNGIYWPSTSMQINSIQMGNWEGDGDWLQIEDSDDPPLDWESLWSGKLSNAHVQSLSWSSGQFRSDSTLVVDLQSGQINDVNLSQNGIRWETSTLNGGRLESTMLPEPVEWLESSVSGHWNSMGWTLASESLQLPGIQFMGELKWPEALGHGALHVSWQEMMPWARAFGLWEWAEEYSLDDEHSSLEWRLNDKDWSVHIAGPSWLDVRLDGNDSAWSSQVDLQSIPSPLQAYFPSTQAKLSASGDSTSFAFQLTGDSLMEVEGELKSEIPWITSISTNELHASSIVHIQSWGEVVQSPQDQIDAELSVIGDAVKFDIQQAQPPIPWSIQGDWHDQQVQFHAYIDDFPISKQGTLPVEAVGTLRRGSTWKDVRCLATLKLDGIAMDCNGRINGSTSVPEWTLSLDGAGFQTDLSGQGAPKFWAEAVSQAIACHPTTWPTFKAFGSISPTSPILTWMDAPFHLLEKGEFRVNSNHSDLSAQLLLPKWNIGDVALDSTHFTLESKDQTLFGTMTADVPDPRPAWMPSMVSLDIQADTTWFVNLAMELENEEMAEWALTCAPSDGTIEEWDITVFRGEIPLGKERLTLANTPLSWHATPDRLYPEHWEMSSPNIQLGIEASSNDNQQFELAYEGLVKNVDQWLPDSTLGLHVGDIQASGVAKINGMDGFEFHSHIDVADARWKDIDIPVIAGDVVWNNGYLTSDFVASHPSKPLKIEGRSVVQPSASTIPSMSIQLTDMPLEWLNPWIDSSYAEIEGILQADLQISGHWDRLQAYGKGTIDTVLAKVPSLGTSFGGRGGLVIRPNEILLSQFVASDELQVSAPIEGSLLHDNYDNWNLDLALFDVPENVKIMDLPQTRNAPVYGTLYGRGTVGVFFWNNQVVVDGEVIADAPTDFSISLISESDEGWSGLVDFVSPPAIAGPEQDQDDPLGVRFDLNIEVDPSAKVTLVSDEENNANIEGHVQGDIQFTLDDWERMTLKGDLEVVEGRYDFALGQFLRKSFVAKPGGVFSWVGDPYGGTLQLDAVYTTRANVRPLLANSSAGGTQNETIDVILHLSGPMLQPNISFDLNAPNAERLIQEALASAVADDNDKTKQAIALLSLQEFMPSEFNTLELGSTGIQEYSIDMVTSQLSRWLSKINEDIEIGISYDAHHDVSNSIAPGQSALQLAMNASLLKDKLEVEGSLGADVLGQEAIGETRLQNIRLLYHLSEKNNIDLTGFSESQSSATQLANSTNQGVGIRWHKSFNWSWPWTRQRADSVISE